MEGPAISEMELQDYEPVMKLWAKTPGIGLSGADQKEKIAAYLERNPGFSLVARQGGVIIGAVLCGHDGRRGFIHHLAVDERHRRRSLGREMVRRCMQKLRDAGLEKCHVFLLVDNSEGRKFWTGIGWTARDEIQVLSSGTEGGWGGCCC